MSAIRSRIFYVSIVAILSMASPAAFAHRPKGPVEHVGPRLAPYVAPPSSGSGTWTRLAHNWPSTATNGPDAALLLTDGTVIVHANCTNKWFKLTPDSTGSYINGTWSPIAAMASNYTPLYFASAVLTSGNVIVEGGEYNASCNDDQTKIGAIYDPVRNKWTPVTPPSRWTTIGDAQSVVLPDGHFMLANATSSNSEEAIATIGSGANPSVSWSSTGTGKADYQDEEGWTLLPNGMVFTVDVWIDDNKDSHAELYSPSTGAWTPTGTAADVLVDPIGKEIGPAVLRPDGTVFQAGANSCGKATCPGHTGIYDSATGTWTQGPDFPQISGKYYDVSDGPAALLPDGNVLIQASPNFGNSYKSPSHFFEFDGTNLNRVSEPSSAPNMASYEGTMLELPTGQIFFSSATGDVEVYTPLGSPKLSWAPKIVSAPSTVVNGTTNYKIFGTNMNGLSQGAAFGDDMQTATNYPLVRLTDHTTGNVCFARTHDFGGGVAVKGTTGAFFDMSGTCTTGTSDLQVVTNGIASKAVTVTVQ